MMASTSSDAPLTIDKFEQFLNERLRPDYAKAIEQREKIVAEIRDYETLLVTIATMQRLKKETPEARLKTLVNIGKHVFAKAVADSNDKIVVRLIDNLFAELPLERATAFVEKRVVVLQERAEQADKLSCQVRAHIDLVLASLDEYAALGSKLLIEMAPQKGTNRVKESAVSAMLSISVARTKRKPKTVSKPALTMLTAMTNTMLQEMLRRAAAIATQAGREDVTIVDLQRVLPQILLDFCA
ncbi:unnamed protein product, partial [Mesorhabditis spiculigera]